jgi:hypothetical protein
MKMNKKNIRGTLRTSSFSLEYSHLVCVCAFEKLSIFALLSRCLQDYSPAAAVEHVEIIDGFRADDVT